MLLNLSELARDVGITSPTARQWLSILEAAGLVLLLQPYYRNFGKRLLKTPKLYFTDTGLLCFLLGISSASVLLESPFLGPVWETFVCGQIVRELERLPTSASLWFWRDAYAHEVDFLIDLGNRFELVECKWVETPEARDAAGLEKLRPVLGASRKVHGRIACRTPHRFPVSDWIEAVNAFNEAGWLQE